MKRPIKPMRRFVGHDTVRLLIRFPLIGIMVAMIGTMFAVPHMMPDSIMKSEHFVLNKVSYELTKNSALSVFFGGECDDPPKPEEFSSELECRSYKTMSRRMPNEPFVLVYYDKGETGPARLFNAMTQNVEGDLHNLVFRDLVGEFLRIMKTMTYAEGRKIFSEQVYEALDSYAWLIYLTNDHLPLSYVTTFVTKVEGQYFATEAYYVKSMVYITWGCALVALMLLLLFLFPIHRDVRVIQGLLAGLPEDEREKFTPATIPVPFTKKRVSELYQSTSPYQDAARVMDNIMRRLIIIEAETAAAARRAERLAARTPTPVATVAESTNGSGTEAKRHDDVDERELVADLGRLEAALMMAGQPTPGKFDRYASLRELVAEAKRSRDNEMQRRPHKTRYAVNQALAEARRCRLIS